MITSNTKKFLRIVDAYLKGTATTRQSSVVKQYFDLFSTEPDILEDLNKVEIKETHDRLKLAIDRKIHEQEKKPTLFSPWKYASIAAALLCVVAISIYLYQYNHQKVKQSGGKTLIITDVLPGSNKAILTLANGSKVSLNQAKIGKLAVQNGVDLHQTKDGNLVYEQVDPINNSNAYNQIETPKGGQYQLTLSDGTKVWLNAASSLRYPLVFTNKERRVELTGEAYFEVAKNKSLPFKVFTIRQSVEVLGTHFDINAYTEEASTTTSLLEGSVLVKDLKSKVKAIIKPGQQSVIYTGQENISIKNIDIEDAVAWKNGYFTFDAEPLESILRKISRWYDVDIEYRWLNEKNDIVFSGTLSRYNNVSKVLKKLELTGAVHFKIEERKIIVIP